MAEKQKWALVTGGSGGIGMEFTKLLAKDGYGVIIVAKPQDELDEAKIWLEKNMPESEFVFFQQDLALQEAADKVYDFTTRNGYEVEILMNNAGFGATGNFNTLDLDRIGSMITLLTFTVWKLTRLYLKDMIARDKGRILITASGIAFAPAPNWAAYCAGKAFSYYYGMAVNQELIDMGANVNITILMPNATRSTNFGSTAGMNMKVFAPNSKFATDPDFVASEAYKALKANQRMVNPSSGFMKFFVKVLMPMARTRKVVKLMNFIKSK